MFGAVIAISRLHVRICPKCDSFTLLSRTFKQYPLQGLVKSNVNQLPQVTRNFSNWKSGVLNKSWRAYLVGWNQQTVAKTNILKRFQSTGVKLCNPLKINTNVKNNVMLYRFERDVLMRGALLFSVIALVTCLFMADNVYLILCQDLFNNNIPLKERLYDHIFPLAAITIGISAGPLIILGVWILTVRTIKYIVLHKGGQLVTIVTYHPTKKFKKMTVPVAHINCQSGRVDAKSYVMIKIKDMKRQYVIDKTGTFINPELFDVTVGAARDF